MGKERSTAKRYCEECGRLIESKRPGMTLCHNCEKRLIVDSRCDEDRRKRKDRKTALEMEDSLFFYEPEGGPKQRRGNRRGGRGDEGDAFVK